jgi:CPA1 family monovalent cation:H+ antiporter
MMDEILNAAPFLLLGLQVLVIHWHLRLLAAGLLLIPTVLAARWISVALPIVCLRWGHSFPRGVLGILTWGGLRGSLSIAMVLSLPEFPRRDLLVGCTYLVMLFSVLVQGPTMRRLLTFYGIGRSPAAAPKKS